MAKIVKTYKTGKATVQEYSDGTKKYLGYSKKNNDGKPTDRKITIIKKPGSPDSSEHTAKTKTNDSRSAAGKKPVPKGSSGGGQHVAHKSGTSRSDTSASSTSVQSGRKNRSEGASQSNRKRAK